MTMTASKSLTRPRWRTPDLSGLPTLGGLAVEWMEHNLVFGPGDLQGEPYKVDPYLADFLTELYRVDPESGRRVRRRALLGVAKGNAKSEGGAATSLFELAGPCVVGADGRAMRRRDPDIPVGAASFEQANIPFGAARSMCTPMSDVLDIFDTEILLRGEPGRLYRVAAVTGTNDGRRPTCFLADETHEWIGRKARVHLVISNGLTKRQDSVELNITTAGYDKTTPAGKLYEYGKKVAAGEIDDPSFLMHWYEPHGDVDLDDPESLRQGLRDANPGTWIDVDRLAERYEVDRLPEHELRRYHLNQWTTAATDWLPYGAWEGCAGEVTVPDGTEIVLAFDGSYNRDATALVGWTVGERPYGFVVGVWEPPDESRDWVVPRYEVMQLVAETMIRYRVVEMACDKSKWFHEFAAWEEQYGAVVVEFPQSVRRMNEACAKFYDAVVRQTVTHDNSPVWARHLTNTTLKESEGGVRITKESSTSTRRIDVAVAGVMGLDRALWRSEESDADPFANIW
jgi:phage terminase large subunit-like protein